MTLFRNMYVKYSITTVAALALLIMGTLWGNAWIFGGGMLLSFVVSAALCSRPWPSHLRGTRMVLGAIIALSLIMIGGSLVYYFGRVTPSTMLVLWAFLPCVSWVIARGYKQTPYIEEPAVASSFPVLCAASLLVVSLGAFWFFLSRFETLEPSRSPWLVVSPVILLAIAACTLWLTIIARKGATRLSIVATIATFFAVVSIAWSVYPLGYGFDPFLHQATLDHIAQFGTIAPKPLYYIGQYAIELALLVPLKISAAAIDPFVLPVLAALLLPVLAATSVWHITKRAIPTCVAALATLLLPLSPFINTTPQGLAFLWSLAVMFLALPELITGARWTPHTLLGIVACATLFIHPLAGLPAVVFWLLVVFFSVHDARYRTMARV
ncbi:hypothetical protein HYV72_01700 [Candidatus Uhrbacteria bacterium]|nr:hypothetical protein [Candidatus Uhrbacteria bacterium]